MNLVMLYCLMYHERLRLRGMGSDVYCELLIFFELNRLGSVISHTYSTIY